MTFMFENQSQDRISDFELKLMDIDSEHLGIPVRLRSTRRHQTLVAAGRSWLAL